MPTVLESKDSSNINMEIFEELFLGVDYMPSLASYALAPPLEAREFEKMLRDYLDNYYTGKAYLFARPGQKQYGVDVVSSSEDGIIAIQCKDYQNTNVTINMVNEWIEDAEEFEPAISKLIIAIADETDGKIQRHVLEVSQKRIKKRLFSVEVLYWEEISSFLKSKPTLLQKYYPFINTEYSQNSSNGAYRDLNELRMEFVDLVLKYRVQNFLEEDPCVCVRTDSVCSVDLFEIEMEDFFRKAVFFQNTDEYEKIVDYVNKIKDYTSYISSMVQPNDNGQVAKIRQTNKDDYEGIKVIIDILIGEINKTYNSIISF